MANYSWVPAFKAVSDWVADYEDQQEALIQILRDIGVDNGLDDEQADGSKVPLTEIDPFTFFATLMKYGLDKRERLFAALFARINLSVAVPTGFDGVPNAQPLKVWLFPFAKDRTEDMIPALWKLFHQARADNIDGGLFNRVLKIPGVGFVKLTQCLFYLAPDRYFPVDAQTKPWLTAKGRALPKDNWADYSQLLSWLADNVRQPFYEISYEAWQDNQAAAFSASKADAYLTNRYPGTRSATTHIVAFKTPAGRELAFDPGKNPDNKTKIKIFVDALPPDQVCSQIAEYETDKSRNHHLKTHAPSLAQGNRAWSAEVNSLSQLTALCDWYEENGHKEIPTMKTEAQSAEISYALNQILYGPPGTGKTYATVDLAVRLAEPERYKALVENTVEDEHRRAIKQFYDQLVVENRIAFTTFHQSFAYEDFIEGIRANSNAESGHLSYQIEDGIFKSLANEAARGVAGAPAYGLSPSPKVWKISIGRTYEKAIRDRYIQAGEARIGWNNTGDLSRDLDDRTSEQQAYWESLSARNHSALNAFADEIQTGDVLLCLKNATTVQAIGVVTSDYYYDESVQSQTQGYAHVRNVNWILTDIELDILRLNNGRKMVQQTVYPLARITWNALAAELDRQGIAPPASSLNDDLAVSSAPPNYVLVIDEINRGNIARIFGELITLLEPDKRKGAPDERTVILPYSKESFSVPANLYVIGTMNTADKSLTQVDLALRRRFEFVEIMPNTELLSGITVHGVDIGKLLGVINDRIEVLLDRDHLIGHSYFLPLKQGNTNQEALLATIFKKRIIPLLQEYFFSDWEKIAWVLNDIDKAPAEQFIQLSSASNPLTGLFSSQVAEQVQDRRYRINDAAFHTPASYQKILLATEPA